MLFLMLFLMGCPAGTSVGITYIDGYHWCGFCGDRFHTIHNHYRPYFKVTSPLHYSNRVIIREPVIRETVVIRSPVVRKGYRGGYSRPEQYKRREVRGYGGRKPENIHSGPGRQPGGNRNRQQRNNFGRRKR